MAWDLDDREGESPSPMEPRPGRMFHSSATGRRRDQTLPEAPGLRQAPHPRDHTAGKCLAGRRGRPTAPDLSRVGDLAVACWGEPDHRRHADRRLGWHSSAANGAAGARDDRIITVIAEVQVFWPAL